MSTQISLKISNTMFEVAKKYAETHGYNSLQDFIRETLREKLFEDEEVNGLFTVLASEESLAKTWLSPKEDAAWAYLQKEA